MITVPLIHAAHVDLGRQRSPSNHDGPDMVPYLRSANIGDGVLDLSDVKSMNFSLAEQGRFSLRVGDVLVTEGSGSRDTVGSSTVWNGEIDGTVCFQNTLLRLRPRDAVIDGRFLNWWIRHAHASGMLAAVASGANILHIGAESLRRIQVALPPLEEQRRIAGFLDDQVTRIDKAIQFRKRQLDMLPELKTAVVDQHLHSTVDRTVRLAWVAHLQSGLTLNSANETGAGGRPMPYLRVANVKADSLDLSEVKQVNATPEQVRRHSLQNHDVLMTEGGDRDKLGRGTLWRCEVPDALHQNHVFAVRCNPSRLDPQYLSLLTQSTGARRYFESTGNQSTNLASTNSSTVLAWRIPLPSLKEQFQRSSLAIAHLERIERVAAEIHDSQRLMTERKRSLITAAVTGEFEVSSASSRAVEAVVLG